MGSWWRPPADLFGVMWRTLGRAKSKGKAVRCDQHVYKLFFDNQVYNLLWSYDS